MKNIFIYCLGLALTLCACIPDPVDIDIPQAEPQLVVASQMLFDRFLLVQVSRSFGALEFSEEESDTLNQALLDQILVDRARVVLFNNGESDTLAGGENGLYIGFNTLLTPGETYQLSVYDSTEQQSVFAESMVLPQAEWNSLNHEIVFDSIRLGDTTFNDTLLSLEVSFEDFAEESYYMINLYKVSLDSQQVAGGFNNALIGSGNQNTFALADQLYPSTLIEDTLFTNQFRPGDTIAVALSHISPIYYQYLSTRARSNGSIFANLLGEPVSYPSNVDGGLGMFNLHLPNIRFLVLEE